MTDELSIQDNLKKNSQLYSSGATPRQFSDQEQGEASWNVPDNSSVSSAPQPETATPFPAFNFGNENEDEEEKPKTLDVSRLLRGVWKRRRLIAIITLSFTVLFVVLALLILQHKWKAEAVIIKRDHPDLFRAGQFSEPFKVQQYNLKTLLGMTMLPSVLEETLKRSAVKNITTEQLVKSITVKQDDKESNVVSISVNWSDAKLAAKIANNFVNAFLENNRQMRRGDAEDIAKSYQAQLNYTTDTLSKVEAELLAFRNQTAIVNLDFQSQLALQQQNDLRVKLHMELATHQALEESIARLLQTIADMPELTIQSNIHPNLLKKKKSELELELQQYNGRYTNENPKIINLKDRINNIQSMIEQGKDKDGQDTFAANPVLQELRLRYFKMLDEKKQSEANSNTYGVLIEKQNVQLASINTNSRKYYQLTGMATGLRQLLDTLRNRIEESKVLAMQNQCDFDILERASEPSKPEPSHRIPMILAGVFLGLLGGIITALALELKDPVLRTRKEILGVLQTEWGAEFQHIPTSEESCVNIKHTESPVAVLFRRMHNDLIAHLSDTPWQSVAIVSVDGGTGKSLIMTNLARTLALKDKPILLVDANLVPSSNDQPAKLLACNHSEAGLLQWLDGTTDQLKHIIFQTDNPTVQLIPASPTPLSTSDALHLGGKRMASLVSELRNYLGLVLYELPALNDSETAFECAALIGKVIVVAKSGQTNKHDLKALQERFAAANIKILGTILTDVPVEFMSGALQFKAEEVSLNSKSSGIFDFFSGKAKNG